MCNIPEQELRQRIQEWRNFKVLHPQAKLKITELKSANKLLKGSKQRLEQENKQQAKAIEKLQLELEELRALKFGKRRQQPAVVKALPSGKQQPKPVKRSAASYRRQLPAQADITDTLRLQITACPECGEQLTDKREHTHYREDLAAAKQRVKAIKKVVQTIIESGKCMNCQQRTSALEIPKQAVIIGQEIRNMVVYLIIVQGQSYTETQGALKHQYGTTVSSGEIAHILEGESKLITPYYNHIVESLAEQPCHYDETSWPTKSQGPDIAQGNYCWLKIAVNSQQRLIWFGQSRGKAVAEELRGDKTNSVGVSDDYGSYKYLFDHHQLCWAHPHRKLRDLAQSTKLQGKTKQVCQQAFKDFAAVYKKSRKAREKLLQGAWTEQQQTQELSKLQQLFCTLFTITEHDPDKLKAIRGSLQGRQARYFTFFTCPDLPLDNNKAERAIRKVVLKRKKSFGCRSPKGADALSILYSVVCSVMASQPDKSFFELYDEVIEFG